MSKVIVAAGDNRVEVEADGQDLGYVVGLAKTLWDETREAPRGQLGFSNDVNEQDDRSVR